MNDRSTWETPEAFQIQAGSADDVPQPLEGDIITPGDRARTATGTAPRATLYSGVRRDMGASVVWVRYGETRIHSLPPRLDLVRHSPDGFEWGYAGSGPAQLAFALCLHVLDDVERALAVYQRVKDRLVVPLAKPDWVMSSGDIFLTIQTIEAGR